MTALEVQSAIPAGMAGDTARPAHRPVNRLKTAPAAETHDAFPRVVARLNERSRVIEGDCGLQWILQCWRSPHWRTRRFHVERDALLRSCRENVAKGGCFSVGEIGEAGWRTLEALPARFSQGWTWNSEHDELISMRALAEGKFDG